METKTNVTPLKITQHWHWSVAVWMRSTAMANLNELISLAFASIVSQHRAADRVQREWNAYRTKIHISICKFDRLTVIDYGTFISLVHAVCAWVAVWVSTVTPCSTRTISDIPTFGTRHESGNFLPSLHLLRIRVLDCGGTRDSDRLRTICCCCINRKYEESNLSNRRSRSCFTNYGMQVPRSLLQFLFCASFGVRGPGTLCDQFNQLQPLVRTCVVC